MTENGLTQAIIALLAASGIALVLSLILLSRYRSKVISLMMASRGVSQASAPAAQGAPPTRPIRFEFIGQSASASDSDDTIFARVTHGPAGAMTIYGIGIALFAAIMAIAYLVAEDMASVMRWLVMFVVLSWPVVIVAFIVTPPASCARKTIVLAYAVTAFLVLLIAALISPKVGALELHVAWLILNAPPTLMLFLFMNRKIRAVGTVTLMFALVSVTGAIMALALLDRATSATSNDLAMRLFGMAADAGMSAIEVLIWFVVIGLIAASALGWLAVRWLAGRYRAGQVSDQSLTVDATVMLMALYHSIMLAYVSPIFILSGFVAFGLFRLAVNVGFGRITASGAAPSLLYLRVFSLGKKSEQMFDAVTRGWRYVGNVQLIAGPDLAATTVEPHEFLDFLSGNTANAFIANTDDLDRRLASMETVRGRDLRYGANDFFCYENIWRKTLTTLAQQSSAVFMDARGFSRSNAGVVFELNQLVNAVPLEQCVLAVDNTTDIEFLQQVVGEAWAELAADSPNRGAEDPKLTVVTLDKIDNDGLRRVLHCLNTASEV